MFRMNLLNLSAKLAMFTIAILGMAAIAMGQGVNIPISKWGPDDEIGAANLLSPALVKKAVKLIKTGKVYSLGIETNSKTPAFPPRTFSLTILQPGQQIGKVLFKNGLTYNDDIVQGWLGIGSQIDGLGHVGYKHEYYNKNLAQDFAAITGLTKLGIEKVPPIVTRGIMLDMAAYFKTDMMKAGQAFNSKEIKGAERRQGVKIRKGDVVLFHTGWMSLLGKDDKTFGSTAPGLGPDGAEYLASKQVIAVGADQWLLDVLPPAKPEELFWAHIVLLAQNGIYILENMNTAELAKDKAYEFMFVLGQAKMTGAVQMIINPVAIR